MNREYLSYKEYELIAKKILNKSFKRSAKYLMKDPEKFGQIISELMVADWKYDPDVCGELGSLEGYRKQRVEWLIKRFNRPKALKTVLFGSLDNLQNISLYTVSEKLLNEVEHEDTLQFICNKIQNSNNLTTREQMCAERFFVQKLDLDTIAEHLKLNKSSVRRYVRKAILKLGVYDKNIKRFSNRG